MPITKTGTKGRGKVYDSIIDTIGDSLDTIGAPRG